MNDDDKPAVEHSTASSDNENTGEFTSFQDAMADVQPLKREPRVTRNTAAAQPSREALQHRRRAASEAPAVERNALSDTAIEPLDHWYVLDFKRPGIQNGVFRKLKQGRYEPQAHLDLHRMGVERARREVFEFIAEAGELGLRSLLIVHGKGESQADQQRNSLLKGCVNHWLRELPAVQAFHSAQPRHGGTGAAYVLLRKSEAQKRQNRLAFAKGRVPTGMD